MKSRSLFHLAILPALVLAGLLLLPGTLWAQQVPVSDAASSLTSPAMVLESAPAEQGALAGPRAVQAGVTRVVADVPPAPAYFGPSQRNTTWMLIGGATLLVGLVIGGDAGTVVALTGGVIGLVGLFRYLQ